MLSEKDFNDWCKECKVVGAARSLIEQIRSSEPSRQLQSRRKNVTGRYPSHKMGFTIQFESHRNELAHIYKLEQDEDVLEYYDQPPPIEIIYLSKHGRHNRHCYTPDFFVIWTNTAGWEECKTEKDLIQLAEDSPNRYQQGKNGQWYCLPGIEYAQRLGLSFHLRSDAEINWIFQQNIIWLEDYFQAESLIIDKAVATTARLVVEANQGITLATLLQTGQGVSADAIYTLIATKQLYVNLHTARLVEPEKVQVFLNQKIAFAYAQVSTVGFSAITNGCQLFQTPVGTSISWDDQLWKVVNTGTATIGLLRTDGILIELPNAAFEEMILQGKIISLQPQTASAIEVEIEQILRHASPQDIAEANCRYQAIEPYLHTQSPTYPPRSIRRWRDQYRKAAELYGSGYIGLLPNHQAKGNRTARLDEAVKAFMPQFIKEHYETPKQSCKFRVYEAFKRACESHEPKLIAPSQKRFYLEIKRRSGVEQTQKREGPRSAIQKEPFYWELLPTTPQHGDRPFEIVHIDHTQLDVELLSSLTALITCRVDTVSPVTRHNLGRPWATFMVDAYSRRLLAVYITFEEPSYRSCMMVLRVCVQRFRRLPQIIVVDNGPEFHSIYFEQLLAHFACTKKHRPPAVPRFGSVVERLFGTANTQLIHELSGNTQQLCQPRQVTKSFNPKGQAVWHLGDLYEYLCRWAYEVYDQRPHPALGQSPRTAFETGLILGGSRLHRRIEYNDTFRILTLPSPKQGKRIVQPGQGVKIHNIYYWAKAFRDPEIERTSVDVKYDPFDVSVTYALIRRQWVQCISTYYQYLQGRSEKELKLVSAELRRRKHNAGDSILNGDKELVKFLNSVEAKEGFWLEQHLRTVENRTVLAVIEGTQNQEPIFSAVEPTNSDEPQVAVELPQSLMTDVSSDSDILEYYNEF